MARFEIPCYAGRTAMDRLFPLLALGFLLGLRHATDADHVVAVTTIVSREKSVRSAARIGALWGLGHTLTVAIVGGAIALLGLVIPPRVGLSMELAVAVMLVALGAFNLVTARRAKVEAVAVARPLLVGIVHGLAGSAAIALLVLATIHDTRWSFVYLGVFGVGTIAGMMSLTTLMALPITFATDRWTRAIAWTAGAASIAFGLFLFVRVGFVDGLFTTAPHWSPQ